MSHFGGPKVLEGIRTSQQDTAVGLFWAANRTEKTVSLMLAGSVTLGTLLNFSELLVPRKLCIIILPGYYLMLVTCLIESNS